MRAFLLTLSLATTLASAQEDYADLSDGSEPAQEASPMDPLTKAMGGKGGAHLDQLKEMFGDKTKMAESMKAMMKDGKLKEMMSGMGDQMKEAMKDPRYSHVMKHTAKQVHHMQKKMKTTLKDDGAAELMQNAGSNADPAEMMKALGGLGNADAMKALGGLGNADAMKALGGLGNLGGLGDHIKELMQDESMKETFQEMAGHMKEVMADGSFKDAIDHFGEHMHAARVDDQKGSLASLLTNSPKRRSEM